MKEEICEMKHECPKTMKRVYFALVSYNYVDLTNTGS